MDRRRFLQSSLALATAAAFGEVMDMHHDKPMLPKGSGFTVPKGVRLPSRQPLQPLPRLKNLATEPGLFRADLAAGPADAVWLPGHTVPVWAYNGCLPGPLIDIDAGGKVEIAFRNGLPQPTTVHWHGLPIPADQDGAPHEAIAPGESRTYRYTLPADFYGTFWYHPHPHGHTAEQVYRGLAGAMIVRDPHDPLAHLPEHHLFISDLRLDAAGHIPDNTLADWADGREGQFVLVNGQLAPVLALQPGASVRLRIWNACSARYLRLAIPGASMHLVGTDGGLIERLVAVGEHLLAPAERAELVVTLPRRHAELALRALPHARGKMASAEQTRPIVLVHLPLQGTIAAPVALPERLRTIDPLPEPKDERRVVFSEGAGHIARPDDLRFLVNGQRYDHARVDLETLAGETYWWEIVNGSDMEHPFHIHGGQFQVVERTLEGDTVAEPFLAWRDTVNLRHAERVRIKLRHDTPGLRMFHCHILEHESLGMMGNLMVKPA